MNILIVGCGYLGRRVATRLLERGDRVWGSSRTSVGAEALRQAVPGIESVIIDVNESSTFMTLPKVDWVLWCVGYDRRSPASIQQVYVEGLKTGLEAITRSQPIQRLVYVSSTGVYGQTDGQWVDEQSETVPLSTSGQACLDAERTALTWDSDRVIIVRYSGLYGPGRIIRREALLKGEPIGGDPEKWLNLIHIEDAARAAIAILDQGRTGQIYLASDDRPVQRSEFYQSVAQRLGAPSPRFVESKVDVSNKRVSNRKLRQELELTWLYPDFQAGMDAV